MNELESLRQESETLKNAIRVSAHSPACRLLFFFAIFKSVEGLVHLKCSEKTRGIGPHVYNFADLLRILNLQSK